MITTYFFFKIITKTLFYIYKDKNLKKLFFQGLGHIALVATPPPSRPSSPTSSMFMPYTAELQDNCVNNLLQWLYPRDMEFAWDVYRRMGRLERENFLDQTISSALFEIKAWVPCSTDLFFNLPHVDQLHILDFLRSWAATNDGGVFRDLVFALRFKRRALDWSNDNAVSALGANNLSLSSYRYSSCWDHHVERIGPYIAQDILQEHQTVDAFIWHSWHWEQVMDELTRTIPKLAAETLL